MGTSDAVSLLPALFAELLGALLPLTTAVWAPNQVWGDGSCVRGLGAV